MKPLAVTLRVIHDPHTGERRDALDQRWYGLLQQAGFLPVLLPNQLSPAQALLQLVPVCGLLLTGGNSLLSCEGDAPERDALEMALLAWAEAEHKPILGVCRGMQMLMHSCGESAQRVTGHVCAQQEIQIHERRRVVNSYHQWGHTRASDDWRIWARADDGVIKAVQHTRLPWWGLMWHPERLEPFAPEDIALLQEIFR